MDYVYSTSKYNQDGFYEYFLHKACENIVDDSRRFYSIIYDKFIDKNNADKNLKIPVRSKHMNIQTPSKIKTVLLADDDEDDRLFFKEALQETKIKTKILLFEDGVELMDHLTMNVHPMPDIIFLDLNLPKKSGLECLAEIRNDALLKNIPIAIYSTSSADEDIEETFLKGADIYIKKPDDFGLIKKILSDVISVNWDFKLRNRDTYFINSI